MTTIAMMKELASAGGRKSDSTGVIHATEKITIQSDDDMRMTTQKDTAIETGGETTIVITIGDIDIGIKTQNIGHRDGRMMIQDIQIAARNVIEMATGEIGQEIDGGSPDAL